MKTQGFRHLNAVELMPHPHFNIISGANGSGKSSVLEAIYFLTQGRSFRTTQLNRLIGQDKTQFSLFGEWHGSQEPLLLGVSRTLSGDAAVRLNGSPLSSHIIATQRLPVLLFNPEQFSLLINNAKARRQLIDWGVFYHYPPFLKVWQELRKALKQRNAALKQKASHSLIQLWDKVLVKTAEQIDSYRSQYIEQLLQIIQQVIGDFIQDQHLSLSYYRGWSHDQTLAQVLIESLDQDRRLGHTQHGPHRADIRLKVNQLPAVEVLSRGQQKLLICMLKMAQATLLSQATPHTAVLLLDDIASEFDNHHATLIFKQLITLNAQLFVTAITAQQLPKIMASEPYNHWQMQAGNALLDID